MKITITNGNKPSDSLFVFQRSGDVPDPAKDAWQVIRSNQPLAPHEFLQPVRPDDLAINFADAFKPSGKPKDAPSTDNTPQYKLVTDFFANSGSLPESDKPEK